MLDRRGKTRICSLCERAQRDEVGTDVQLLEAHTIGRTAGWLCIPCVFRLAEFILDEPRDKLATFWKIEPSPERLEPPRELEPEKPRPVEEWDSQGKAWKKTELPPPQVSPHERAVVLLRAGDVPGALYLAADCLLSPPRHLERMDSTRRFLAGMAAGVFFDSRVRRDGFLKDLRRELFVE